MYNIFMATLVKKIKDEIFSIPEELLEKATTHRSWSKKTNNEQLEFLGDAVLELSISLILFLMFPNKREGELTMIRASLVSTENLYKIAKKLEIEKHIKSRNLSQDALKKVIVNTFEALLGAYFLHFGWERTKDLIFDIFKNQMSKIKETKNPKNILQEYFQKRGMGLPEYKILKIEGPEHKKVFSVGLFHEGKKLCWAKGNSIKEAEIKCARKLIKKLKIS